MFHLTGTMLRPVPFSHLYIPLLLACLKLACCWGGTEMNPSVMVLGKFDFELRQGPNGRMTSRCINMVEKVSAFGGTRVNFVPTHYWMDSRQANVVDYYCAMDGAMYCHGFSSDRVDSFREGMRACMQAAVDKHLSISLVPHLDDGSGRNSWRNGLLYDPLAKYGGYSYDDVMVKPLVQALQQVHFHSDTRVWFAITGEMSATVMRYPNEYIQIINRIRNELRQGKEGHRDTSRIKVGISLNWNKLDEVNWPKNGARVPGLDQNAVYNLFSSSDFVGISAYSPFSASFGTDQLEVSVWQFESSLKAINPALVSFIRPNSGKELHYSEFGLGGGRGEGGCCPARSPAEVAQTPFNGISGPYIAHEDPWKNHDVREFMRRYYREASKFFMRGGGPTFHLDACFLWNLGSWDVLGIYPESTVNGQGSYRDEVVVEVVKNHNQRLTGRQIDSVASYDGRKHLP